MPIDVERTLAEHASLPPLAIPASAKAAVKATLLDTMACMIAGQKSPECRELRELQARRGGAPESSVVGGRERIPALAAAICNAAQAHWYEWDDLHDVAISHTSAVLWPALLATAEAAGLDGPAGASEVIAAAAVAYDIATRVGMAVTPFAHYGWYATAHGSAVGAAAGAARLWRLPTPLVLSAMGLAATAAGLTRQPILDRVNGKNALGAQTVAAALTAVDLARAGVEGAPRFLTGDYGFIALMAGGRGRPADAVADLGLRFSVEEMSAKPYPCCRAAHQGIDLALRMRARHPGMAQAIRKIRVDVPQPSFEVVGAPFAPGDNPRVSAQFSMAYTVAVALLQGRLGLADFDPQRVLANREATALAARVEVVAFPLAPGQGQYELPVTLTCTLEDGTEYREATALVKGSPQHPLTLQERQAKLLDCASWQLAVADVEALQAAVDHLERGGLAPAMAILRRAGLG